jgi:ornithine cyclodeaminase/alanine dehydrogenase-like protein (mu-crystallin family)
VRSISKAWAQDDGDAASRFAQEMRAPLGLDVEPADVLCGRVAGRSNDDEVFVFDSTGTALQDAAAASVALSRATAREIGLEVAFT